MRKDRRVYLFGLRYIPGTRLARRYPGLARGQFKTPEIAERVRQACVNAEQIEVVDVREAS